MWSKAQSLLLGVVAVSLSNTAPADTPWMRELNYGKAPTGVPVVLAYIERADHDLSAVGFYRYIVGRPSVQLHGKADQEGNFLPIVMYEVATKDKTNWQKLEAATEQSGSETVTISPTNPVVTIKIDMQPFRNVMGTSTYGRVVLENKDSAIFEIEDLLPTMPIRGGNSDFRASVLKTDDEKRSAGFKDEWISELGNLIQLTSFQGRMVGDFVLENSSNHDVKIDGTKTPDGFFWPKAILQAANGDGRWRLIGNTEHPGVPLSMKIASRKAERVRVMLTDYMPLIGKFKFGRVVFSNGKGGVFLIDLLRPDSR
jgi:hypothetical protein